MDSVSFGRKLLFLPPFGTVVQTEANFSIGFVLVFLRFPSFDTLKYRNMRLKRGQKITCDTVNCHKLELAKNLPILKSYKATRKIVPFIFAIIPLKKH